MFYKGRIVIRDGEGPGDYDPGKTDSLGDNHWTEWHGSSNVRVVDHEMNVLSPIVNELYHLVRGYRWTFSSDISETRMVCAGDFTFIKGEAKYFGSSSDTFTLLVLDDTIGKHVEQMDLYAKDSQLVIRVDAELFFETEEKKEGAWSTTRINIPTTEEFENNKETWIENSDTYFEYLMNKYPKVGVCGPAVRIKLFEDNAEWRWLFPHVNGVRAAVEHLRSTTHEDDWLQLQTYFNTCTPIEQERAINHFQNQE